MRYETFSFAPLTSHSLERRQSHSIAIIIINCLFCVSWLWQPLVTANTDFISPPTLHWLKLGSSNYYYLLQSYNICLALVPCSETGYITFLIYWALSLKNIIFLWSYWTKQCWLLVRGRLLNIDFVGWLKTEMKSMF